MLPDVVAECREVRTAQARTGRPVTHASKSPPRLQRPPQQARPGRGRIRCQAMGESECPSGLHDAGPSIPKSEPPEVQDATASISKNESSGLYDIGQSSLKKRAVRTLRHRPKPRQNRAPSELYDTAPGRSKSCPKNSPSRHQIWTIFGAEIRLKPERNLPQMVGQLWCHS